MAQVTPGMKFNATRSDVATESSLGTAEQNSRTKYWAIEDIQDLSNVAVVANSLACANNLSAANRLVFGTEEITNGDTLNPTKTVSYLTIAGSSETSTLAAGQEGQIRIIAVNTLATGGGHTISLSGGGLNTLIFDSVHDGCTLICVNGKWRFCANNGVNFT